METGMVIVEASLYIVIDVTLTQCYTYPTLAIQRGKNGAACLNGKEEQ